MNIENIEIRTVDNKKLIDFLNIQLEENQELHFDSFGIFEDKFGIDTDCCFWILQYNHINDKIVKTIDIEFRIKKLKPEGGGYSIRMDGPDFIKTISLEDYLSISENIKLTEFIRYNYNPRIQGNQKLLMQYIKASNPQLMES